MQLKLHLYQNVSFKSCNMNEEIIRNDSCLLDSLSEMSRADGAWLYILL